MSVRASADRNRASLLLIDLQTKLLPHIDGGDRVVAAASALVEAGGVFGLPMFATVQYVRGLGPTHPELAERCAAQGIEFQEKSAFSACRDAPFRSRIDEAGREQVIVAGIEAHVCVQQTVLDLLGMGRQPYVCADAVSSRRRSDLDVALDRMRQAGAVITTTEAVMFELCQWSGTAEFKRMLDVVKRFDEARGRSTRHRIGTG